MNNNNLIYADVKKEIEYTGIARHKDFYIKIVGDGTTKGFIIEINAKHPDGISYKRGLMKETYYTLVDAQVAALQEYIRLAIQ